MGCRRAQLHSRLTRKGPVTLPQPPSALAAKSLQPQLPITHICTPQADGWDSPGSVGQFQHSPQVPVSSSVTLTKQTSTLGEGGQGHGGGMGVEAFSQSCLCLESQQHFSPFLQVWASTWSQHPHSPRVFLACSIFLVSGGVFQYRSDSSEVLNFLWSSLKVLP